MTNTKTISKAVANELAIGFLSAIPDYIERNKEAYLRYLVSTGQQSLDPYYSNQIKEAADDGRE